MTDSVEKIKERLGIAEVVGGYLKLEKAGKNLKARCPFHNEKTASFFVSPDRGSYYCFGCFPPGQLVKTPFGYHPIETFDSNHYVNSGYGHIRKILATEHRNYEGDIIDVTVPKLYGVVSLTSDHEVPIVRPKTRYFKKAKQFYRQTRNYHLRKETYVSLNNRDIERHADILKVPAGELRVDDFVLYPVATTITDITEINLLEYLTKSYTKGPKPRVIPYTVPVNEDLLKLIGYYIAEGSSHRAYIRFSLGSHEEDFAQEIVGLIKNIFGLSASIYRRSVSKSGIEITACNANLADIFSHLCGRGADHKHIPFIFQELPPAKQMLLVGAINKGDGHTFTPNLSSNVANAVTVVSRVLIEQITDILLRNKIFPSVCMAEKRTDKLGVNHRETYSVKWSETALTRHAIIYVNNDATYWLLPIKNLIKRHYSGPVYNLTVDEDHSYVARNFVVSNCGAKGDIFSFVEQFEGLDFKGALKLLAERAGVKLEYERGSLSAGKSEREKIFQILEEATKYFEDNLKLNDEAKSYLQKRGVAEKTRIAFRIGYAPDEWRSLLADLKNKKFAESDLEKAGLIKKAEATGNYYDRFRGRIIFPIADSAGRIVGFSGRILKGKPEDAKYLNSPETELFTKSRILYGLDKAKAEIRRHDFAILVEGQMDLLMSHQAGVTNTVASSGTALTEQHLDLLKRFSNRLLLVFDPDEAGFKAALRGAGLALTRGLDVKVAVLPKGLDPADLILKNSADWKDVLKNAIFLIDFLLAKILNKGYDKRQLAKAVEKEVLPYIASLKSRIEQSHYISEIADKANIKEDALWEELRKAVPAISAPISKVVKTTARDKLTKRELLERRLFGLLFAEKDKKLESELKNILGEAKFKTALEFWQPFREEIVFEIETILGDGISEKEITELLANLKNEVLRDKFLQKTKELAEAEKIGETAKAKKLMEECQKLSKEITNY